MRLFQKKEPLPLLDASPHLDAGVLKDIFTNQLDPRIRFFLQRIRHEDLDILLDLRNSALRGTTFSETGSCGMEPGQYSITGTSSYREDDGTERACYCTKHAINLMMDIFFSSVDRYADPKQDPLLNAQPIAHHADNNRGSQTSRAFMVLSGAVGVYSWYQSFKIKAYQNICLAQTRAVQDEIYKLEHEQQCSNLQMPQNCYSQDADTWMSMGGMVLPFLLLIPAFLFAHAANIKKYIISLKAEFNDAKYDALLNRLCRAEQVQDAENIDWSHDIKVNGKSCSIRTWMLILLTSFNDKMYSKIFSEMLPKLITGGKFDVCDETFSPGLTSLTRKIIFHIDSNRENSLQNEMSGHRSMGMRLVQ